MYISTQSARTLIRLIAFLSLFGLVAFANQAAWGQPGKGKNGNGNRGVSAGKKHSSPRKGGQNHSSRQSKPTNKQSAAKNKTHLRSTNNQNAQYRGSRPDDQIGNFNLPDYEPPATLPTFKNRSNAEKINSTASNFANESAGNRSNLIESGNHQSGSRRGRQDQSTQQSVPVGPLYPAGWEQFRDPATQGRFPTTGSVNNKGMSTGQNPSRSSLTGQDQETGEIFHFPGLDVTSPRAGRGGRSVVDSEGWDEVPEGLLFGFQAKRANSKPFGNGPGKVNGVIGPRDAASGLPSGKRK